MIIWRPILARHVSLDAAKRGDIDLLDILKLNALMNAQQAAQAAADNKAR